MDFVDDVNVTQRTHILFSLQLFFRLGISRIKLLQVLQHQALMGESRRTLSKVRFKKAATSQMM